MLKTEIGEHGGARLRRAWPIHPSADRDLRGANADAPRGFEIADYETVGRTYGTMGCCRASIPALKVLG